MTISKLEGYAPSAAAELLVSLAHDIVNFNPATRMKKGLSRTFLLNEYGSRMFGLEVDGGIMMLGIPELFYPQFYRIKWRCLVASMRYQRAFFVGENNIQGIESSFAIGIKMNQKQILAMAAFDEITCCKMDSLGRAFTEQEDCCFKLKAQKTEDIFWELNEKEI